MEKFQHPQYLWFLLSVPVLLLVLAAYAYWRRNALARLGQTARLMPEFSARHFRIKSALLALGLSGVIIAWANPQLGAKKQTTTQKSADVFIALDISQSMMCRDVSPNRLELARIFTQKLIQTLEGERIGLILFAGNAFLAVPLSTDYSFILQSLQSASPEMLTEQGTAIGPAFALADKSFDEEPGGGRAIILITDGEDHDEEAVDAAKASYDKGAQIACVGAGTTDGGPIPENVGEFSQYKRDDKGEIVRTRLNEDLLKKIAQAGGGQAYNLSQGDRAVQALERMIDGLAKRPREVRSQNELESRYQWFLFAAILFLGVETLIRFNKKPS